MRMNLAAAVLEASAGELLFHSSLALENSSHCAIARDGTSEIFAVIDAHCQLEAEHEKSVAARNLAAAKSSSTQRQAIASQVHALQRTLSSSLSGVCRALHETPSLSNEHVRILDEKANLVNILQTLANDLRSDPRSGLERLSAYVEAASSSIARLDETREREDALSAEVESLSAAMASEEAKHARKMHAKKEEVRQLKESLRLLRLSNSASVRYARKEAAAWSETVRSTGSIAAHQQLQQLEALEEALRCEEEASHATMSELKAGECGGTFSGGLCAAP